MSCGLCFGLLSGKGPGGQSNGRAMVRNGIHQFPGVIVHRSIEKLGNGPDLPDHALLQDERAMSHCPNNREVMGDIHN